MCKVISISHIAHQVLSITFDDGLQKEIDFTPFIGKGVSAALRDEEFFKAVQIDSGGGIYWPNGFDFCPNYLHDEVPAVSLSRT